MKQLLFTTLLLGSFSVNASIVQGTSFGNFENPIGNSELVTTGIGTNHFTWGEPSEENTNPSGLTYTGKSFTVQENEQFVFGTLNFFNGTINSATDATNIDLDVNFSLNQPTTRSDKFSFHLDLVNTDNLISSRIKSADYLSFNNAVAASSFTSGGVSYTLEFLGFDNLTANGFTQDNSFRVYENASASVDLIGRITSTPPISVGVSAVPIPAAVWLFGFSLLGVAGMRRKSS